MNSLHRRSPFQFFTLVSLLTIPFYLLGAYGPDLTKTLPIQLPISALVLVCPAGAALWLTYRERGALGVRALLTRILDVRRIQRKRWLLPTLFLMPAVLLLSFFVQRLLGQTLPIVQLSPLTLAVSFALFFVGAICEEVGWTGYITEPLQQRYGALLASLLLGTFWALWHIVPFVQAHRSAQWIVWQCVGTVAVRVLMVWIYNNAGQSVFTGIAFHATINVAEFSFPANGSHYDPRVTGLILVALAGWLCCLNLACGRRRAGVA